MKFKINDLDTLSIVQGEDKTLSIRLMDDALNPLDLTGASIVVEFPKKNNGPKIIRRMSNQTFLSAAVDISKDQITLENHGLSHNEKVTLTTSGTLPAGLATSTDYFVIVVDADTFQLSESLDGEAIDLTGVGSGTHTVVQSLVTIASEDLGKIALMLPQAVTSDLNAGEKQSIEVEVTISSVKTIYQLQKSLSVIAQEY